MKKINYLITSVALYILPMTVSAGGFAGGDKTGGEFGLLVEGILEFLNGIVVPAILALGFVFFVWGMFQFFIAGGSNDESKEKGRSLMIYATLGFVIIIIFWGVINLLASSIGLGNGEIDPPTIKKGLD